MGVVARTGDYWEGETTRHKPKADHPWLNKKYVPLSIYLTGLLIYLINQDFIVGLERDYPSTVSTIARTCAKVKPKDEAQDVCALCERYINLLCQPARSSFIYLK